MRIRNFIVLVIAAALLSSCLVKSLHPFYTAETVHYDKRFVGSWTDKNGGKWEVKNIKDVILEENDIKEPSELDSLDRVIYDTYKLAYYVTYKKSGNDAVFLVMPFKINDQLFLDFKPLFSDASNGLNSLTEIHLVGTHSLVKFDFVEGEKISMRWLDEDRVKELFEKNKIRIKHEKILGFLLEEEILLTAKSSELQKFIKKYIASNEKDKWRTDTKYMLTRDHSKP